MSFWNFLSSRFRFFSRSRSCLSVRSSSVSPPSTAGHRCRVLHHLLIPLGYRAHRDISRASAREREDLMQQNEQHSGADRPSPQTLMVVLIMRVAGLSNVVARCPAIFSACSFTPADRITLDSRTFGASSISGAGSPATFSASRIVIASAVASCGSKKTGHAQL